MKALVVYCHPKDGSFTAAVRDMVIAKLDAQGAEIRITDLYARGFSPVLTAAELDTYEDAARNTQTVEQDVADLKWCDTLIFVYPTWWYGLPAVLKGWLDRVFVPEIAFLMPTPERRTIARGLSHIERLGVFTTCGASRWLTFIVGAPGKRTLFRGIGFLCAKPLKKAFAAHYLMDSSTPDSRQAHLDRVAKKMDRFLS
ncbi:MAG: NAD(P)H-dependent oxidoreductase [Silicimonas sp.]|nr:NAD(P)H-dependent oxidoreductase [Silicimonas sp.]